MMLKLTFAHNKMEFWIRADHVRSVERRPDNPLETAVATTLMTTGAALGRGALDILLPVVVIGGIVGGVFTPTEAGAVAVAYVLVIGGLVYRTLDRHGILRACRESIVVLGSVMFIIAAASLIQYVLGLVQAAEQIGALLRSISSSQWVFLLLANLLLLVLGCVMEVTAILVLMTPILVPVLPHFGIDPVHFGVVMALNLTIGLLTAPVGLALYVTCSIGGVKMEDYRAKQFRSKSLREFGLPYSGWAEKDE